MPPEPINAKQLGVDLETPLGGLLIVNPIPHTLCLDLLNTPNDSHNIDVRPINRCNGRSSGKRRDGRGSDGVASCLLCAGKDVGVVVGVGVENRNCLDDAIPRV